MGLKDAAKQLMAAAGVPVTPGYMGDNQGPAFLASQAAEIGYPVLIKAVAGGGGKGMRKVEAAAEFADSLASCQREALASFGNAHVLIEKYIQRPRHIEVQVFGDTHGNVVHLFERDCSLQRRHQKVIEEAPAPGMDEATREALCAVAVKAARAVDYVGAGTIEFIADGSEGLRADRIWFMEMNTRLQVEHPVTEEITGVDLVEWQLRVASGEPLPKRQDELSINGWAMEARLYAEDPAKGFLPSVGRLEEFFLPDTLRLETGMAEGDEVSPFYDPMIAKLITQGDTREQAIIQLIENLKLVAVWPVRTNAGFLWQLLSNDEVMDGQLDTGLISRLGETVTTPLVPRAEHLGQIAGLLSASEGFGPFARLSGFRLNAKPHAVAELVDDQGERYSVSLAEVPNTAPGDSIVAYVDAFPRQFKLFRAGSSRNAFSGDGAILAPMPGKVIAVEVTAGDTVTKGQKLLVLEAMKMEHALTAPFDGVVAELHVQAGGQVQVEALLARITAPPEPAS
jgi:3-methylcrotonyl-CoA carboxylase alpha subunit